METSSDARFSGQHTFDVSKQDADVNFFERLTFRLGRRISERSYAEPFDRFLVRRVGLGAITVQPQHRQASDSSAKR